MLNKIFKKTDSVQETNGDILAAPKKATASTLKKPPDNIDWQARLDAATGDDNALLLIAKGDAPLKIRQAAVEAMQSEDGLRSAEREFREHDRRIHREAKLRLEIRVAERLARAEAVTLIAGAAALLAQEQIPANRFVEIDRAWRELDVSKLEPAQVASFQSVSEQITHVLRSRGDQHSSIKRWINDADRALAELQAGSIAVAETGLERDKLAAAYDTVNRLNDDAPVALDQDAQARDVAHKKLLLDAALQVARSLDARLTHLDGLIAENSAGDSAAWHALPPVSDTTIAALLTARFDVIRRTQQQTREGAERAAKNALIEKDKARRQVKISNLSELLATAEAALSAGHIVDATASLASVEAALKGTTVNHQLQTRIDMLKAEITRLKGWQHWGGGRAREDLVGEAELLAKAITDEKLHIKSHADAIEKLRERWKELDKLGGATSRELWGKFDGALKTAYLPVSAQLAKLKAVRQENLAARKKLISALDAIVRDDTGAAPTDGLRELARALEHFQGEWRKLGPLEHTVPHKAQAALQERMKTAVARLETPLSETRRLEAEKREQLITRAKALGGENQPRDVINKVRELQTEWQKHAKAVPLQRNVENRLWSEFKAATDAIFVTRDAANTARDAVYHDNAKVRNDLIARIEALGADSAPGEIKRTISEVDTSWRRTGEAPRNIANKLEQRFRDAREKAQSLLAGSAKRTWQKTCDALAAKLALCTAVEAANGVSAGNEAESWTALPELITVWEKPLRMRFDAAIGGQMRPERAITASDGDLLNLEAALDLESPAAFQAARREMKLRAMKNAIEARQVVTISNTDIEQWIGGVVGAPLTDTVAARRFEAIMTALRDKPLR